VIDFALAECADSGNFACAPGSASNTLKLEQKRWQPVIARTQIKPNGAYR
jgi:hypothetical protein